MLHLSMTALQCSEDAEITSLVSRSPIEMSWIAKNVNDIIKGVAGGNVCQTLNAPSKRRAAFTKRIVRMVGGIDHDHFERN